MKDTGLVRQMFVLKHGDTSESDAWFGTSVEAGDGGGHETYVMSREDYEDMGSPKAITIAVFPGDRQDLLEDEGFPR